MLVKARVHESRIELVNEWELEYNGQSSRSNNNVDYVTFQGFYMYQVISEYEPYSDATNYGYWKDIKLEKTAESGVWKVSTCTAR